MPHSGFKHKAPVSSPKGTFDRVVSHVSHLTTPISTAIHDRRDKTKRERQQQDMMKQQPRPRPHAAERRLGTIDDFENNMLENGEIAFHRLNPRNTQGFRETPDVAMPIADHFLDGLPGDIRVAVGSAIDIAKQISNYVRGKERIDDIDIAGLYGLIEQNIDNIRNIAHLSRRIIEFTSFVPYWGIIVKAIAISNDCYHIYESHNAINNQRSGPGQGSEHYQATLDKKTRERSEHIRSLIKHSAKFGLKVGSAAGVTAIFFKPPEIAIVTGQVVTGAVRAALHHQRESRKIEASKWLTWSLIQEAKDVYSSEFWEDADYMAKKERLRINLGLYGLDSPEFYGMAPTEQVQIMYGTIYQNI